MTESADPALALAQALADNGRLEEAIEAARAVDESPAQQRLIAVSSTRLGRWPEALSAWDALASGQPDALVPADALFRALALAGMGQREQSIAAAHAAFARDAQQATAGVYLNLLLRLGAEKEALEAAQHLRAEVGQRAARAVADRLRADGNPALALSLAHALVHAAPTPENYALVAQAATEAKDKEIALDALYEALAPSPPGAETGARLKALGTYDVARVASTTGRLLQERGAHEGALPHFELAADVLEALRPEHLELNADVWSDLGLSWLALRQPAAAARLFARSADRFDELGDVSAAATARVQRARALALAGQGEEASAALETLIRDLSSRSDAADALAVAWTELGREQHERGDLSRAIASFEAALRGPLDASVEVNVRILCAQALLHEDRADDALAAALPALYKADAVTAGKRAELQRVVEEARRRKGNPS